MDNQREAIAEIDEVKAAKDDKRRAYHRSYYSQNKGRIKEQRLRHAAEVYLERLKHPQSV